MDRKLRSSQNICQEIHQSIILLLGTFPLTASRDSLKLTQTRAGANFSAISGGDTNALRWDRLGYEHMMKFAEKHGDEACVAKTQSFEYWDEVPSRVKIDSMAEYLQDVSNDPA